MTIFTLIVTAILSVTSPTQPTSSKSDISPPGTLLDHGVFN